MRIGTRRTLISGAATGEVRTFEKRNGGGPFAAGIYVSGNSALTVTVPRGTQVAGSWYRNFDANQGYIVTWLTPAWAGSDNTEHVIMQWGTNGFLRKNTSNLLELSLASGVTLTVDVSAWASGTTYRVEARWDCRNPIDGGGGHYLGLSIDDSHTFGHEAVFTPDAPDETIIIGCGATSGAFNGTIEGLTIYRRVGWDGTNGINLGNGDEIASTADKCKMTGSWDVTMCVPTNASTINPFVTSAVDAWTHPHASNLIAAADGFMLSTAWANWSDEGTPINKAVCTAAQQVFQGGYQYESDAANEGMYKDITVAAADNWVVRAVGHSDGTSVPKVILYDQINGAEIGSLTGSTSSTRTAPDVLILTGQAPGPRAAYGRIKINDIPADGDTVTIGTTVYTFKTDISSPGAGEIYVLRVNAGDATNKAWPAYYFHLAVTAGTGANTYYKYGAGAGAHANVTTTWDLIPTVTPTAKVSGTGGNAIVLTCTGANVTVGATGTLENGSDATACTTLRVKLVNTAASGVTYWHQIEVLTNSVRNPSMAHGAGDPWIPGSWNGGLMLAPGSVIYTAAPHTGTNAIQFDILTVHTESTLVPAPTSGQFLVGGFFGKTLAGDTSGIGMSGSSAAGWKMQDGTASNTIATVTNTTAWKHSAGVMRMQSPAGLGNIFFIPNGAVQARYGDDMYSFVLTALTLTVG